MPAITMYTKQACPFCDRAKALLRAKGQSFTEIDIEADPATQDEMIARSQRKTVPQIWIGDQHVGGYDDLHALEVAGQLDALLGLGAARASGGASAEHVKVAIVGSGPAGYTAAIYTGRAELQPLVIAGFQSGGQLMLTTEVENYPGFPEGVTGPELMNLFRRQAERFGARIVEDDATSIDLTKRPFSLRTSDRSFTADAVILAMGASARWLGIASEQRLMNRGVSACATCDGALYRGKAMAVVGGGDTALEEALFLTRFATRVYLVHRRDALRASKIMQERALRHEKIEPVWDSAIDEVLGGDFVESVRVKNLKTGATRVLPVEALFVAIGHQPNTKLLEGQLALDSVGYLKTEPGSSRTAVEGVFACGDAMDPGYRQAITAAGTGCMAAIDAERWLAAQGVE